jgi:hypothetical protein
MPRLTVAEELGSANTGTGTKNFKSPDVYIVKVTHAVPKIIGIRAII